MYILLLWPYSRPYLNPWCGCVDLAASILAPINNCYTDQYNAVIKCSFTFKSNCNAHITVHVYITVGICMICTDPLSINSHVCTLWASFPTCPLQNRTPLARSVRGTSSKTLCRCRRLLMGMWWTTGSPP